MDVSARLVQVILNHGLRPKLREFAPPPSFFSRLYTPTQGLSSTQTVPKSDQEAFAAILKKEGKWKTNLAKRFRQTRLLATGRHANTDRALAVFMTCYNAHLESNVLPEPSNLYTLTGAGRYVGMRQADPEMNTDNDGGNFNTLFFVKAVDANINDCPSTKDGKEVCDNWRKHNGKKIDNVEGYRLPDWSHNETLQSVDKVALSLFEKVDTSIGKDDEKAKSYFLGGVDNKQLVFIEGLAMVSAETKGKSTGDAQSKSTISTRSKAGTDPNYDPNENEEDSEQKDDHNIDEVVDEQEDDTNEGDGTSTPTKTKKKRPLPVLSPRAETINAAASAAKKRKKSRGQPKMTRDEITKLGAKRVLELASAGQKKIAQFIHKYSKSNVEYNQMKAAADSQTLHFAYSALTALPEGRNLKDDDLVDLDAINKKVGIEPDYGKEPVKKRKEVKVPKPPKDGSPFEHMRILKGLLPGAQPHKNELNVEGYPYEESLKKLILQSESDAQQFEFFRLKIKTGSYNEQIRSDQGSGPVCDNLAAAARYYNKYMKPAGWLFAQCKMNDFLWDGLWYIGDGKSNDEEMAEANAAASSGSNDNNDVSTPVAIEGTARDGDDES